MAAIFVESWSAVIATTMRLKPLLPRGLPAALNCRRFERKTIMTAEKFRTLSSWVAAAFLSAMMLTAAATSHPVLI
jgi:hypothetical protein